jgi:hypothetical protein
VLEAMALILHLILYWSAVAVVQVRVVVVLVALAILELML